MSDDESSHVVKKARKENAIWTSAEVRDGEVLDLALSGLLTELRVGEHAVLDALEALFFQALLVDAIAAAHDEQS